MSNVSMKHPTAGAGTSVVEHEGRRYPMSGGVASVPPHIAENLKKKGWKEVKPEAAPGTDAAALEAAKAKVAELEATIAEMETAAEEGRTVITDLQAKVAELEAKLTPPAA